MEGYTVEEFLEFVQVDIKNSEEKLAFLDGGGIRQTIEENLVNLRLMEKTLKETEIHSGA